MRSFKKLISVVLIMSMIFTTQSSFVLAEGVEHSLSETSTTVTSEESTEEESTTEEESKEESTTVVESKEEGTTVVEEESTSKEESESSSDESSSDESTSAESTTSDVEGESDTHESTVTEESEEDESIKNVVASDSIANYVDYVEEIISSPSDIDSEKSFVINFDILNATMSQTFDDKLLGSDYISSMKHLGNIDSDYIAPKVTYENDTLAKYDHMLGDTPLPASYDSRNYTNATTGLNYVPAVRSQSPYGICWAFATAGMLETSIRKKGLATTDDNSNLSELSLAYFQYNLKDVTNNAAYLDKPGLEGNDHTKINAQYFIDRARPDKATWSQCGGNLMLSTKILSAYNGMVVEDVNTAFTPAAKTQAERYGINGIYAFKRNGFVPKDVQYINNGNRELIKKAIMENGSIGFSYYAEEIDDNAFHDENGVRYFSYTGSTGPSFYRSNGKTSTNHAIMIIGWDDNIEAEKFFYGTDYSSATSMAASNGGWLCRNSWGEDFPYLQDGYFYIAYDEPSLSDTFFSVDAMKADTYKYNYHYDTTGYENSWAPHGMSTLFSNVFKVSGEDENQVLEAVNLSINAANAEFDVHIYTNDNEMSNPFDGTHRITKRYSCVTAGIYTYELGDKIELPKDTYFSIVVEPVSADGDSFLLFIDNIDEYPGFYYTYNEVSQKQSFFKSKTGSSWTDCAYNSTVREGKRYGINWRIKGLANPGIAVSFDSDGGEGTMTAQVVEAGVPTKLKKNTFKKTGYRFKNWIDSSSNEYADEAEITINSSLVLKAVWEEANYTLSPGWYDRNLSGLNEKEVTGITLLMYPSASPSDVDASWIITGSDGLIASRKGTEVYIYAPDTSMTGKIYAAVDSSMLFSTRIWNSYYSDYTPDLNNAFRKCKKVENLDLLDTSNTEDMSLMFAYMGRENMFGTSMDFPATMISNPIPTAIDVSGFDTHKVTNMSNMFDSMPIENINLSSFDTYSLTNARAMFGECALLQSIDLSTFGTATISNTSAMFTDCRSLTNMNLQGATFENVTDMSYMFQYCTSLTSLDLSSFKTANVTNMAGMFDNDSNLQTIIASKKFVRTNIVSSNDMFNNCSQLTGGAGTTYSAKYVLDPATAKNMTYAWIDGKDGIDGYFTGAASVTVTFDLNGKGVDFTNTFEKGEAITRPVDPTYTGYNFIYWYEEGTSADVPYDFTRILEPSSPSTKRLIAKWNPIKYTIAYNIGTGTYATKPADITNHEYGTNISLSNPNNIQDGYRFDGWFTDLDFAEIHRYVGGADNELSTTDGDTVTIYAKWYARITYSENGHGTAPVATWSQFNHSVILPDMTESTGGWTFNGWEKEDGTFVGVAGTSYNVGEEAKVLRAKWTAHQYTVDYDLVGVTATKPSTILKTYGTPLTDGTLQNPSGIESGYEFLGWFKSYDSTTGTYGDQWTGADDLTNIDGTTVYIYAKWKTAIVYNANGHGTAPASSDVVGETTVTLPSMTEVGYIFGGWYDDANIGTATKIGDAGEPFTTSSPTTLYAKWTAITYKIYYKNVEDSSIADGTYVDKTYDVNVTLDTTPTKTGYDFDGWYTDNGTFSVAYDGTGDISTEQDVDKNIYAKWAPRTYTIKYNVNAVGTAPGEKTKTYGTPYTVPNPSNIPTGYTFKGWFTDNGTFADEYTGNRDLSSTQDAEVYVYARWQAKITYNANGHGTAPASVDVFLNSIIKLASMSNVIGWTFDTTNSWYAEAECTNLIGAQNSNYTVTAPKNMYAKWNENEYTITYDKQSGDWASSYDPVVAGVTERRYTQAITLPVAANIERTGYTFLGWYKNGDSTQTIINTIAANTDESVTVVAKWLEKTYNITLYDNGGSYVDGYNVPVNRKYTDAVTLPTNADIKKTGHTLEGWHEQSNFSDAAVTSIAANTDAHKTFYAKWNPENYAVTLHANGGTINSGDVTNYTYGVGATLPTDVTKANSIFKGWWTSDGSTSGDWGTQITVISTTDTEAKDYYAKWAESFAVTFNLLSGTTHPAALSDITNIPDSQNIESGNQAVRPSINPQAANYEFDNWYTDDTFTTVYNFSSAITQATTIYAKWNSVVTYEVSFDLMSYATHPAALGDITNAPSAQHIVNGRTAVKPNNPASTGYKFIGWYTDSTCTTAWNFNTMTITEVKTIYAKWEVLSYTITYITNSGSWESTFTPTTERNYGVSVSLPTSANISRHGYTFEGWYEDSQFVGTPVTSVDANVSTNKTYYASWTLIANAHIIRFNANGGSGSMADQAVLSGETVNINSNAFTRSGWTFVRWRDQNNNGYGNGAEVSWDAIDAIGGELILKAEWQQNPSPYVPSGDNSKDTGGSSSGPSGVGPIPQNQPTQLPNAAQGISQQTQVSTTKSEQIVVNGNTANWTYDQINNTWKLSALNLVGGLTVAANGFYILNQVTVVMENNQLVPKNVQDTYYFDAAGNMVTGWIKAGDNRWYFFENAKTIHEGKLCLGWKLIDGAWYFFSGNDGSLLVNTTTSDGYKVGADGRWIQ